MKLEPETMRRNAILQMREIKQSKYNPHQSFKEKQRRMKQIAAGTLKGPAVSMAARYRAAGLSSLDDISLVKGL